MNRISPTRRQFKRLIEINTTPNKNPVSVLMEATAQSGLKIIFSEQEAVKASFNDKLFACNLSIEGIISKCVGYGSNKKEAKTNAAVKAIQEVLDVGYNDSQVSPSPRMPLAQSTANNSLVNAVGQLQEMAASRQWKPGPEYEEIHESGQPHCKTFTVECRLLGFTTLGNESTKKKAKQSAALEMLEIVKGAHSTSRLSASISKSEARSPSRFYPRSLDTSPMRSPNLPRPHSPDNLSLPRLVGSDKDINKLLQKAKSKNIKVEWKDIPEQGTSGNYVCLVRVACQPKVVGGGSGPSRQSARAQAACNALDCWDG